MSDYDSAPDYTYYVLGQREETRDFYREDKATGLCEVATKDGPWRPTNLRNPRALGAEVFEGKLPKALQPRNAARKSTGKETV